MALGEVAVFCCFSNVFRVIIFSVSILNQLCFINGAFGAYGGGLRAFSWGDFAVSRCF